MLSARGFKKSFKNDILEEVIFKTQETESFKKGLKTILIEQVKSQAEGELNKTDWYVVRKAEEDTAIPSAITTHRRAVRSKAAAMETSITNASDTPALETLYTSVDGDERPIGYIPVKNF